MNHIGLHKRLLSLALAFIMVLGLASTALTNVFATDGATASSIPELLDQNGGSLTLHLVLQKSVTDSVRLYSNKRQPGASNGLGTFVGTYDCNGVTGYAFGAQHEKPASHDMDVTITKDNLATTGLLLCYCYGVLGHYIAALFHLVSQAFSAVFTRTTKTA